MQTPAPEFGREKLAEWHRRQVLLGIFFGVGGGTYSLMRLRIHSLARPLVTLKGESANLTLWINDARFEYGPVDMFLSPTPPPKQVTGLSIHLKKGPWVFLFEATEREHSWFSLENETVRFGREIEAGDGEEEMAAPLRYGILV
jgi:hypothetical protein